MVTRSTDQFAEPNLKSWLLLLLSVGFIRCCSKGANSCLFWIKRPQATSEIRICFTEKWQVYGNGEWNYGFLLKIKRHMQPRAFLKVFALLCQEE